MIDCKTVAFIGMLNELAWRSADNNFIPVRNKKLSDGSKSCNTVCTKLFYDVDVLSQADDRFVYFRLIEKCGDDKHTYYPHAFVAIPRNSEEDRKCVVVFADEEWNKEKELFLVYDGHWTVC